MSPIRHRRTPCLLSWSWVFFLLVLLLSPLNTSAANLTGLSITPPNPTIQVGKNVQLTATGSYDDGTQQVIAQAKQVSVGSEHSCALGADGTIKCWGLNNSGQLGDGTTTNSTFPVTVSGISTAVAVSTGGAHTCALLIDGTIKCWGDNSQGQLASFTLARSLTPVAVSGVSTVVALSAGTSYTCALSADGTIKCWGRNNDLLGYGTTPVAISGINTAVAVSAGDNHACALLADRSLRCWGDNSYGQLGNGNSFSSSTPVTVFGLTNAVAVSAGGSHTCAVLIDATARCWGNNAGGQLGNGVLYYSSTPVAVSGINTAVSVSAGGGHACAVLIDGTARCWGSNIYGELGNDTFANSSIPVTVTGLNNVMAVSVGSDLVCAVLANGMIKCWGYNRYGQLGNGLTTTNSSIPVTVSGISTIVALSAGTYHACALLANGTVRCWGSNGRGELGNGTTIDSSIPVTVSGISTAVAVSAGGSHTCALLADGTARCWGSNDFGQLGNGKPADTYNYSTTPVTVSGISTAVAVNAGGAHACAVLADSTVRCWGNNDFGQIGNGSYSSFGVSIPVTVSGISTAVSVSTGLFHTCAVLAHSTVRCWGSNTYGGLGDGTTTNSSTPVVASGIRTAVTVRAGRDYTCAVLADGTVRCWGSNSYGELGNGTTTNSSTPVTVSGISTVVVASAGSGDTCMVLADGTIKCWGNNGVGQLGNGTTINSLIPVTVSGINTAKVVSAGYDHTCALLTDGTARCWGSNSFGQLGDGLYGFSYPTPTSTLGYLPLVWTSSNSTVASVNGAGKVQALTPGTTLITASLNGISTSTLITVSSALTIDGFWPGTVPAGGVVIVFGQGFVPMQSEVQINGIPATFIQVVDPTLLFFMLPPGNTQGPITVTTPYGTATSGLSFGTPLTGVIVTGLWPSVVAPGQLVILFGSGFVVNGTTVKLNGVDAPIRQVLYPDLMFFMVPPTATSGYVTVTTATGSATSASLLTIK